MSFISLDDVRIEVTRKPIRTLRMRICPPDAAVHVSVPLTVSESAVLSFIKERRGWIHVHRSRILARQAARPAPCTGVAGDKLLIWGNECTLAVSPATRPGCILQGDTLHLFAPPRYDAEKRMRLIRGALRQLLMERMETLADVWAQAMGVPQPALRIRKMKSRWGTCNPSAKRIWINEDLVKCHPDSLEYVMVHELAHLLERGHTDRFRNIMDSCLPDWKKRRENLNNQ